MALVEFETQGAIGVIRFNRPEMRNAVNTAMMQELRAVLARIEADDSLKVAVVTGAGSFFCAGMDLGAFAAGERPGITDPDHFAGFVSAIRSKPMIAAVNGGAVAGGFEIALACDMIVAEEGAFFALPEVKRGIIAAGGGAFRLPRRLPFAIACEMLLAGDPLKAERALGLGLINALAPKGKVVDQALDLAGRIAANAPLAVKLTLEIARMSDGGGNATLWALNDATWNRIERSEDALEGALAFKEKRPPVWRGR